MNGMVPVVSLIDCDEVFKSVV